MVSPSSPTSEVGVVQFKEVSFGVYVYTGPSASETGGSISGTLVS
jgi:hypothetical protein